MWHWFGTGRLFTAKTLTTPTNPVGGVLDGIQIVCARANCPPSSVAGCIHGTTLATNALIERKGAKSGSDHNPRVPGHYRDCL